MTALPLVKDGIDPLMVAVEVDYSNGVECSSIWIRRGKLERRISEWVLVNSRGRKDNGRTSELLPDPERFVGEVREAGQAESQLSQFFDRHLCPKVST